MTEVNESAILQSAGIVSRYSESRNAEAGFKANRAAIRELPGVLAAHGVTLSEGWMKALEDANNVDKRRIWRSREDTTIVSRVAGIAIQDAFTRKSGGETGLVPQEALHRALWNPVAASSSQERALDTI